MTRQTDVLTLIRQRMRKPVDAIRPDELPSIEDLRCRIDGAVERRRNV